MNKLRTAALLAAAFAINCGAVYAAEGTGSQAGLKKRAAHAAEATQRANQKKAEAEKKKPVLRKVSAKEIGKNAVCPVTGEKMKVKADTISASYKGKVYYFCCPGCDQSFLADPEKYAVKKKPAAAAKTYVCPMGDYKGDKPGKCPKCGMTLEEKEKLPEQRQGAVRSTP